MLLLARKGTAHTAAHTHVLLPLGKEKGEVGAAVMSHWEVVATSWLFGDLANKLDISNLI